ncbi:hypothetical protein CATRI_10590 [Corynebacterium atrinae]|uniref:hypothetical protein n=1 Tax=Corynebacterium atrinae TaxID=1336740 RepID=UPI003F49A00F|nr:hypothetical protein CATRI_10590 [Corynebacterium atrinae]
MTAGHRTDLFGQRSVEGGSANAEVFGDGDLGFAGGHPLAGFLQVLGAVLLQSSGDRKTGVK